MSADCERILSRDKEDEQKIARCSRSYIERFFVKSDEVAGQKTPQDVDILTNSLANPKNFLGLSDEDASYDKARVAILPIPYEETVSYKGGTGNAPDAIIEASSHVELYDEELGCEPYYDVGVATLEALKVKGVLPGNLADTIDPAISKIISDKKLPIIFGGEHSITPAIIASVCKAHKDITVLQFDAHADLRQEYEGERMSHACAMARVREFCPVVSVGIRNLSLDEARLVRRDKQPVFFAHEIAKGGDWMEKALAAIKTRKVYVTIDVDAFDSSTMPATGTPEPGGLDWYQVTNLLRQVCAKKEVIGFDLVELAPAKGLHACDFLVAKLAYKCIGYWRESQKQIGD